MLNQEYPSPQNNASTPVHDPPVYLAVEQPGMRDKRKICRHPSPHTVSHLIQTNVYTRRKTTPEARVLLLALLRRAVRSGINGSRSSVALGSPVRYGRGLAVYRRDSSLLQLRLFGVAAVVLGDVVDGEAVGDAQDEEEPKQVESLQRAEEGEGDDEGQGALVLLGLPVDTVGPDCFELGEEAEEDAQVEVVTQVDPHAHEGEVVGTRQPVVEVVEGFGGLSRRERLVT